MNKEDWQKLYNILNSAHSEFLIEYPNYKNGRNKKIRDKGERVIYNAIRISDINITQNEEAFKLLTGGDKTSDFGRAIIYDEFTMPMYFGRDMTEFLKKIELKIESLKE